MTNLLVPFAILAAIGFVLSVCAHVASLLGLQLPGGQLVWCLHGGIFVVWIPTVLVANRMTRGTSRKDFWKVGLSGCPPWMRRGLYGLFAYAVVNFVLFMASSGGHSRRLHGDATPDVIRAFSGHWMVFYAAAFAMLYSVIRSPQLLRARKCFNGHTVSAIDRFCPTCGRPLGEGQPPP